MDGRLKVKEEGLHLKGCQEVLLLASVKPSNQPYEEADGRQREAALKLGTEKGAAAYMSRCIQNMLSFTRTSMTP